MELKLNEKQLKFVEVLCDVANNDLMNCADCYVAPFKKELTEIRSMIFSLKAIPLTDCTNSSLPKLPEFAAANFDSIAEISTRLTTGNVSHHARTIEGLAKRNAEFIRKHYC